MHLIYARRSSDRDDLQTLSIEQQVAVLRELAATRGIEIAEVLEESASGRDPGRPIFGALMKRVREGEIAGILVWRLDRLARNMVDGGEIIYYLSEGLLKEIVTPEATYSGTPDSKFLMAMLFGAATKYSDDLASAVRRGNEDVLKRGKVPGPVPLGYVKTHEHELTPGSGTVITDPERFDTVKRIWTAVLAGEQSVREIWLQASSDWGLTTRPTKGMLAKPIGLTNLYGILRNPFYAGKIRRGSTLYKGEHPPMVTWEQFQRVQQLLVRRPHHEHVVSHDFLYHGLLRCGACGRAFTGERHEKNGHVYTYYRCDRKKPGQFICREPEVREADITDVIAVLLDTVTIDRTVQEWAFEAIAWWRGDDEVSPEKLVRRTKAALARAEQELTTLTDLVLKDYITEPEYVVRRKNQLAKIEHLREALAEPAGRAEAWRAIRDEKRKNGLGLGSDFRAGDNVAKRKILSRTCSEISVKDGKPHLQLRTPYVFRSKGHSFQSGLPCANNDASSESIDKTEAL